MVATTSTSAGATPTRDADREGRGTNEPGAMPHRARWHRLEGGHYKSHFRAPPPAMPNARASKAQPADWQCSRHARTRRDLWSRVEPRQVAQAWLVAGRSSAARPCDRQPDEPSGIVVHAPSGSRNQAPSGAARDCWSLRDSHQNQHACQRGLHAGSDASSITVEYCPSIVPITIPRGHGP